MNLDDKFARIAALRPARRKETPAVHPAVDSSADPAVDPTVFLLESEENTDRLSALLGARVNRNHYGEHLSLLQWYSTPEICRPDARSLSLLLPQITDEKSFLTTAIDPEKWLFLDTETTGLSGGTGTYAFMVGIAWWDAGGLQVEQFFMRDLDEEHSLLLELSERMKERPVLVTFNG
ncbi:MAG TPA: ribonuclease H-like domain-containing protein, partial [Candidatus Acidoferrales bacterium]|nr:ribonuclease H-like domain-containing protein [Candidatus Acidoferrales bacterium]